MITSEYDKKLFTALTDVKDEVHNIKKVRPDMLLPMQGGMVSVLVKKLMDEMCIAIYEGNTTEQRRLTTHACAMLTRFNVETL